MIRTKQLLEKESDENEKVILNISGINIMYETFIDRPFKGVSSIITSGVQNTSSNAKELIFSFDNNYLPESFEVKSFMSTYLDLYYLVNCEKISEGDFIMVENFQLLKNYNFSGFYLIHPAYFPEKFEGSFHWLIPVFKSEIEYLKKNGSNSFQELIEKSDVNLLDLSRNPIT